MRVTCLASSGCKTSGAAPAHCPSDNCEERRVGATFAVGSSLGSNFGVGAPFCLLICQSAESKYLHSREPRNKGVNRQGARALWAGRRKAVQARTGCPWGSASSSAAFPRTWPAAVAPALPLRRPAAGCRWAPAAGRRDLLASHNRPERRASEWINRFTAESRTRGAWVSPLGSAIVANPVCAQLTIRRVQRARSLRPPSRSVNEAYLVCRKVSAHK